MIKRTIEISGRGHHLFLQQGSLAIRRDGEVVARIPLEDIGLVVLDCPDTTYTHIVLSEILAAGGAVVPCGRDHLPAGLFLPQTNSLQTQRLHSQVGAPLPLRKRLWKQLVQAKVRHQAAALGKDSPVARKLRGLVATVRSGDPANVEAHAARVYWPALLGKTFRRKPKGKPPNNLLNYGYMVLRAAVARAIAAAGLHPSLGLHHHGRSNTFCLADDLLEPLRPLVDRTVRELHADGRDELDRPTKAELLSLLTLEIEVADLKGPLQVALERVLASLVRCYAGDARLMELPRLWST